MVLRWTAYKDMDVKSEVGTLGGTTYMVQQRHLCFALTRSNTRAIRALNGGESGHLRDIKDAVVDALLENGEIQIDDSACHNETGYLGCIVYDPEGTIIGVVGDKCENVAGFRTEHLGTGRCYIHGGMDIARRAAARITHGRTSKVLRHQVSAQIQKYILDPNPTNLTKEMAIARSMLESAMDIVLDKGDVEAYERALPGFRNTLELIGRTADRLSRIEQRHALTAGQLAYVQVTMVECINTYIDDPIVREQAAQFLMGRLSTPTKQLIG